MEYTFQAELWEYEGPDPWVFVTVPVNLSEEIRALFSTSASRFGSIKITAVTGGSSWNTSLFPDKNTATYVLPVKKEIRKAENLNNGDPITVTIRVLS